MIKIIYYFFHFSLSPRSRGVPADLGFFLKDSGKNTKMPWRGTQGEFPFHETSGKNPVKKVRENL